jgi:WD40 repeat protein
MDVRCIKRLKSVGPCTAVETFERQDTGGLHILAGIGGYLHVYSPEDLSSQNSRSIEIFQANSIHGIRYRQIAGGIVCVYGGKFVQLLTSDFTVVGTMMTLDDMVLGIEITDCLIFIGCAHNFLDVFSNNNERILLQRIQNSVVCVLFSMEFFLDADSLHLQISSGTAFGKILCWESSTEALSEKKLVITQDPLKILQGHTGVVFKVRYSGNRTRLASVSDDRTVRVWDLASYTQIFVGWGHVCRVWDVIFFSERDDYVLTCGEECTIKAWCIAEAERMQEPQSAFTPKLMATFQGHRGKSCWRLANLTDGRHVVSVGNDSSVKVWEMSRMLLLTPEDSTTTVKRIWL